MLVCLSRPTGYGDSREPRPRSRSPVHGREGRDSRDSRDSRDHRDGRDLREHSREPRPGPPRDHDNDRYRSSVGREKDSRDAPYR